MEKAASAARILRDRSAPPFGLHRRWVAAVQSGAAIGVRRRLRRPLRRAPEPRRAPRVSRSPRSPRSPRSALPRDTAGSRLRLARWRRLGCAAAARAARCGRARARRRRRLRPGRASTAGWTLDGRGRVSRRKVGLSPGARAAVVAGSGRFDRTPSTMRRTGGRGRRRAFAACCRASSRRRAARR